MSEPSKHSRANTMTKVVNTMNQNKVVKGYAPEKFF